jgi:hypothetical protein
MQSFLVHSAVEAVEVLEVPVRQAPQAPVAEMEVAPVLEVAVEIIMAAGAAAQVALTVVDWLEVQVSKGLSFYTITTPNAFWCYPAVCRPLIRPVAFAAPSFGSCSSSALSL